MAELLPNDILREVGKYWNGHRVLHTCKALYTSWNPDYYVVTERIAVADAAADPGATATTIIRRMPNGACHGESMVMNYYSRDSAIVTETIEYDRGVAVILKRYGRRSYKAVVVVNGWIVEWMVMEAALRADMIGCMWICDGKNPLDGLTAYCNDPRADCENLFRRNIYLSDFIATAQEMTAQMPPGDKAKLELMLRWGRPMPGTYY